MKRSTDRILTTHTGSLARPKPLLDLMKLKESGESYDHAAYDQAVKDAVKYVVEKQVENVREEFHRKQQSEDVPGAQEPNPIEEESDGPPPEADTTPGDQDE